MRNLTAIFALFLALAMQCAVAAAPARQPSVAVEGILQVGEFLGPPNYGENPESDRIERSYFLQLPAPLADQVHDDSALAGLTDQSKTTHFVQLAVSAAQQPLAKKLAGKRVKVVGTLFEAETGHHRTPVLVDVQSISAIKKWRW